MDLALEALFTLIGLVMLHLPLAVALVFGHAADRMRSQGRSGRWWAAAAYAVVVLFVYAGLFALGVVLQLLAALVPPEQLAQAGAPELTIASPALLAAGMWVPALLGMLLLLPPVRRGLAVVIPIDPDRTVHAVALSLSLLIVVQLLVLMGFGLGNLAEAGALGGETAAASVAISLWIQQLLWALLGVIGAGWLIRRGFRDTLRRLAIVVPRPWQAALGLTLGPLLAGLITALFPLLEAIGLGVDEDVQRITEQTIGPLFTNPLGILTIGLAAAIGEETIFRGALQPRFGLVLTAVLFTLLHANYGLTVSTGVVLVNGLVLGVLRTRTNTTTTMLTHAGYNITLGVLALLELGP